MAFSLSHILLQKRSNSSSPEYQYKRGVLIRPYTPGGSYTWPVGEYSHPIHGTNFSDMIIQNFPLTGLPAVNISQDVLFRKEVEWISQPLLLQALQVA
jgi:hypothetical protein